MQLDAAQPSTRVVPTDALLTLTLSLSFRANAKPGDTSRLSLDVINHCYAYCTTYYDRIPVGHSHTSRRPVTNGSAADCRRPVVGPAGRIMTIPFVSNSVDHGLHTTDSERAKGQDELFIAIRVLIPSDLQLIVRCSVGIRPPSTIYGTTSISDLPSLKSIAVSPSGSNCCKLCTVRRHPGSKT